MSVHPATYDDTFKTSAIYDMTLQFEDGDGNPTNLTGYTVSATIWNLAKTTQYATFSVNSSGAAEGRIVISLTAIQTTAIPLGDVFYDLAMTDLSGNKQYYLKGIFYVTQGYS
jgi:hypothetical protein